MITACIHVYTCMLAGVVMPVYGSIQGNKRINDYSLHSCTGTCISASRSSYSDAGVYMYLCMYVYNSFFVIQVQDCQC